MLNNIHLSEKAYQVTCVKTVWLKTKNHHSEVNYTQ